jgi:ANTAR domain
VPGSNEDMTRLIAVVERQRRELDRLRAAAADQSVIAMARGALMERLGLSSADAASQLAELSAATGMSLGEMAAAVLSPDESSPAVNGGEPRGGQEPSRGGPSGPGPLLAEVAAELAADGAELAGALAAQVLAPLGAVAVALWLLEADGTLSLLGETGLSPTCGGTPAVRNPTTRRLSARRTWRAPCWPYDSETASCSA